MFEINLEKSLIRNKQKTLSKNESLIVEKMTELNNNEKMSSLRHRFGLWQHNERVSNHIEETKKKLGKFKQNRIFHANDIKNLCCIYGLRFLQVGSFNGQLDEELPLKIEEFEKTYSTRISPRDCYIAAPKNSFKLGERPKDPLFFCRIHGDYYYLIHKWGKDISVLRWFANFPLRSNSYFITAMSILAFVASFSFIWISTNEGLKTILFVSMFATFVTIIASVLIIAGFEFKSNEDKWDSHYID